MRINGHTPPPNPLPKGEGVVTPRPRIHAQFVLLFYLFTLLLLIRKTTDCTDMHGKGLRMNGLHEFIKGSECYPFLWNPLPSPCPNRQLA